MNLPELTRIRQRFADAHVADVAGAVRAELDGCGVTVPVGAPIAVAVGSRGIDNLVDVVRETVAWVKRCGGQPFIVPAMGSHGGATAAGQKRLIEHYGVTESAAGAPIRSSMAVIELDRGEVGIPVYFDAEAAKAFGTILVNRIKPHTSFHGRYESGLMKMIAIGLGKHEQAKAIHRYGLEGLRELMPRVADQVLRQGKILLGVALVENAYDKTMRVKAIPAAAIPDEEPPLLETARANMPHLPIENVDILIVDEMGKNISGLGIDPNIIGRLRIRGQPELTSPCITIIVVRSLTADSHGNANGMGLADIITRRLFDRVDLCATYENALTTTFIERARVPLIAETDRQAVEFALQALGGPPPDGLRIVRIRNTLHLEELLVSPAVLDAVGERPGIEVVEPAGPWFDETGAMWDV